MNRREFLWMGAAAVAGAAAVSAGRFEAAVGGGFWSRLFSWRRRGVDPYEWDLSSLEDVDMVELWGIISDGAITDDKVGLLIGVHPDAGEIMSIDGVSAVRFPEPTLIAVSGDEDAFEGMELAVGFDPVIES